jgi:hypothetical protein
MAGIMFTDGKHVLAGYNQHTMKISGIGGKAKRNETAIHTAIRETVEELFELEEIPQELSEMLYNNLLFDNLFTRGDYTTFIMDFKYDLQIFFDTISKFILRSRVYSTIPKTLEELLMTRIVAPEAELSHLMLLPCVYNIDLSTCFLNDIYSFKNCEKSIR